MDNQELTFKGLRDANKKRIPLFTDSNGNKCHNEDGSDWNLNDWGVALSGEVGELCNFLKKVRRGDFTLDECRQDVADEIADVLIYLDVLASRCDISLAAAVRHKFNSVSSKKGIEVYL